jgi:hypothetical protein
MKPPKIMGKIELDSERTITGKNIKENKISIKKKLSKNN